MAVVLDATSSGINETAASTLTVAHTCTGSNLVLVAYIASRDNPNDGSDPTGVTYNGTAMTLVTGASDAGQMSGNIWYLINPSTGTNNIVATWSSSKDSRLCMAHSYTGASQTGQPDASAGRQSGNEGTGTTRTLAVTTVADNCMVFHGMSRVFNTDTTSSPHTRRVALNTGTTMWGFTADGLQTPAGSNTITWTASGWQFDSDVMRCVSIAPAVASSSSSSSCSSSSSSCRSSSSSCSSSSCSSSSSSSCRSSSSSCSSCSSSSSSSCRSSSSSSCSSSSSLSSSSSSCSSSSSKSSSCSSSSSLRYVYNLPLLGVG